MTSMEVFEPDFTLEEEMQACACMCTAGGSGGGSAVVQVN